MALHGRRRQRLFLAATFVYATVAASASTVPRRVTVYSAPGLHDGSASWLEREFQAFTRATGVEIVYVQAGAGAIVGKAARERSQVDVIITTPPFIQEARAKGLLGSYLPAAAANIDGGSAYFQPLAANYLTFIYNSKSLPTPPGTFVDLLDPKFKGRLQYSTPGVAGDGTSFLLQVFHSFEGRDAAYDYLGRLQSNNVGPSPVTGPLTALVNDAKIIVSIGDLQMNLAQQARNPNVRMFWPADGLGRRSTLAMPYCIGLGAGTRHGKDAKSLIDFLLGEEAQRAVVGGSVRGDVERTDAASAKWKAALDGVAIWRPDWERVLRELPTDLARWHAVTRS